MHYYHVYILHCIDGSYYTGITNDLDRRLIEHKSGLVRSCYTYKRRPLKLVYSAQFTEVLEAIRWEKVIKRWSRKKKEALIRREFEGLPRLAKKDFLKKKRVQCVRKRLRNLYSAALSYFDTPICHPE